MASEILTGRRSHPDVRNRRAPNLNPGLLSRHGSHIRPARGSSPSHLPLKRCTSQGKLLRIAVRGSDRHNEQAANGVIHTSSEMINRVAVTCRGRWQSAVAGRLEWAAPVNRSPGAGARLSNNYNGFAVKRRWQNGRNRHNF